MSRKRLDQNSTGDTPAVLERNPFTGALSYQTASIHSNFSFSRALLHVSRRSCNHGG